MGLAVLLVEAVQLEVVKALKIVCLLAGEGLSRLDPCNQGLTVVNV